MNLNTDKQKSSLKGVYAFYSVIITLCILALFVFNLNIYAKAVLCTFVVLCVCIMRSLKHTLPIPPDRDTEMQQEVEEKEFNEAGLHRQGRRSHRHIPFTSYRDRRGTVKRPKR